MPLENPLARLRPNLVCETFFIELDYRVTKRLRPVSR